MKIFAERHQFLIFVVIRHHEELIKPCFTCMYYDEVNGWTLIRWAGITPESEIQVYFIQDRGVTLSYLDALYQSGITRIRVIPDQGFQKFLIPDQGLLNPDQGESVKL